MGSNKAAPMLLCSSGMKGCRPQVFRVFYAKLPSQTQIVIFNTNCYILTDAK